VALAGAFDVGFTDLFSSSSWADSPDELE
jgi:hypothetical protein